MVRKCPQCDSENTDTARFCSNCGTLLPKSKETIPTRTLETPTKKLTRGSIFADRFEIIEELGKGGMGRVYRVEDNKTKEEIALKLLKPEIATDKKTIERFRAELTTARKIRHKNICGMYDFGEDKGSYYITMEYVPGEDLKSLIRRVKVDIGTSIRIAIQVCEGLSEAHRLGIVHRDLKPSNIIIDREGNAHIMDFGIARTLKEKGMTCAGVMIGTPEYMSPEQVEAKEVDQRSDIYSLGIILYEMLTGRLPFEADTAFAIGVKHKSETPKNPKDHNLQISENLSKTILKCLEKDPKNRHQSCEELLMDLNKVEAVKLETQAELKSEWKSSIAVLPFINMSANPEQEYFCDGLSEDLINALTQIKDLRVVARTSAFSFKDKDLDIREVGKKLNVKTVLEGSVRKAGNRLRITAQLINVADGYHLWSERFDKELADVFDIQDEISLAITEKLKIKLLGEEKEKLTKRNTSNASSYNIYLKALFLRRRLKDEDLYKSIELFNLAIDEDPSNAMAWAGLAYAHMLSCFYGGKTHQEASPLANEAVTKALELDPLLVEAYEARAAISTYLEWDWENGLRSCQRMIELNSGYSWGYFHLAHTNLYKEGKFEESIRLFMKALELDPLNPAFHRNLGCVYLFSGDTEAALETFQRMIEMDPKFPAIHYFLGMAYMQMEMYEEALMEMKLEENYANSIVDHLIGIVNCRMGNKDRAYEILTECTELSHQKDNSPQLEFSFYGLAALCFSLEEDDLGFEWLEKAYETHDTYMYQIKIDFLMDRVRSDPRFISILKKMKLD
jgi:serine/threonine protein kinase